MKKLIITGLFIIVLLGVVLISKTSNQGKEQIYADVTRVLSGTSDTTGFQQATDPVQFSFPRDLGAHDRFQTEWWYFTGNLQGTDGRGFGYQLTFFRRALSNKPAAGNSKWRTNQVYMGHFAVSDAKENRFHSYERFSRESIGLAGADAEPFRVWLENWEVFEIGRNRWKLEATAGELQLSLELMPLKNMVFNGENGLSRKGPNVGAASYYYSNTRIKSSGILSIGKDEYQVSGFSWLDREWSTSVLSRDQTGWDWFAIQLEDMREIMLFQIRKSGGGVSSFSAGSMVDIRGRKNHLTVKQFNITVTEHWHSPETGKSYPSGWLIQIPEEGLMLSLRPMMENQEHRHSFAYWEGAVEVYGEDISGKGYVEMTGY